MKRRLSSIFTFPYKIFPALWSAFSLLWVVGLLIKSVETQDNIKIFIVGVISTLMSVFACWMCAPLKRVYIDNDTLYVSNYVREIKISLADIEQVHDEIGALTGSSLRRMILILRSPSEFGKKIIFAPKFFSAREIANELRNHIASRAKVRMK